MKKLIFNILMILIMSSPLFGIPYSNKPQEYGSIVINCENGGGWVFICSSDNTSNEIMIAFKGRVIRVPEGEYTLAFDQGGIIGFNDGFPRTEAEYHVVEVKTGQVITVNVKSKFK